MEVGELTVGDLIDDFARSLKAQRKAPKTIRAYTDAARKFATWAEGAGVSTLVGKVERHHVEALIVDQLDTYTPATAVAYYRHLQQFWRWVVAEGEIDVSPMAAMSAPKLPERPIPIYTPDELRALLKAAEGQTFEARRDTAMLHMFIATGVRLAEMAGMTVERLARDEQAVLVIGWIGQRGGITTSGITQMLRRLGRRSRVADVRPHRFRHTSAHRAQVAGITESDLMEVFGWRSPEMVRKYGPNFRKLDLEADL